MVASVKLLFFLSGAAGLVYQVVWVRLLAGVLGSTVASHSAVFSVFLLCLAAGAAAFGRAPLSGRRALALYGLLELLVAVTSVASTAVLSTYGGAIAQLRAAAGGPVVGVAGDCLFTAALIGVPTFLMGGTLPTVLNAFTASSAVRDLAPRLYGYNTLGAAAGALLCGFVLIWRFGLSGATHTAAATNVAVGVAALLLAPRLAGGVAPARQEPPRRAGRDRDSHVWRVLAALSGFAALASEVLWGRLAALLIGEQTLSTTALLFAFIAGLGVAAWVAPRIGALFRAQRPQRAMRLVAGCLLISAATHLLCVFACERAIHRAGVAVGGDADYGLTRNVVTLWAAMTPPVFTLGLVFPLLVWSARRLRDRPGRTVGDLYWVNTVGAVIGAAAASFAFTTSVGTLGGFLAIAGLLAAIGAGVLLRSVPGRATGAAAVATLGVFLAACWIYPRGIVLLRPDERLLEASEDEYGVQVLVQTQARTLRMRNNRRQLVRDLGDAETALTQQMAAHWAVLLADRTERTLNIGTGYGVTAGALSLYDDVRTVDTIELLPFVVRQQPRFRGHNFAFLDDPRARLHLGDGFYRLKATKTPYDIITVNVLDPHLPGSSALYTVDFWRTARDRLRPGGVLTQLVWGDRAIPTLVRGLDAVFPTLRCFPAYGGDARLIVALRDAAPVELRLDRVNNRAEDSLRDLFGRRWRVRLERLLAASETEAEALRRAAKEAAGPLHTIDRPVLEFRWSR